MQLFGLVCFRLNPNPDDNSTSYIELLNRRLLHWVNSSGKIYVSHTIVGGIYVLRFSVGMEPLLRKSVMSLPPGKSHTHTLARSNFGALCRERKHRSREKLKRTAHFIDCYEYKPVLVESVMANGSRVASLHAYLAHYFLGGKPLKELLHRSNRTCTRNSGALLHGGGTMVVASWLKGIGLQNSTRPPTTSIFAYGDRSSTVVHCRERTRERVVRLKVAGQCYQEKDD
ncbi:hypothetical protein F8388_011994 [Cannabis sativa]|uniref:Uncharacterized protein n=1 Tax=Cannabis sativa TaxID=3483 RepID=A0A7J6GE30_CANSA|nr:hypothetical protein F8388_011994 [Cannabis sativa]